MNTKLKVTTKLVISEKFISDIRYIAGKKLYTSLEKLVRDELETAYNLGVNQGMLEALAELRKLELETELEVEVDYNG